MRSMIIQAKYDPHYVNAAFLFHLKFNKAIDEMDAHTYTIATYR